MITTYSNIEAVPAGTIEVVSGPSVNPTPPQGFYPQQGPGGLLVYIVGPKFSGALAKIPLPMPPNTGAVSYSFQVNPDASAQECAQALEFDLVGTKLQQNYNCSFQINYAEGGMCQIINAAGAWIDTGFKVGILPADTWTPVALTYQFNYATKVFSVLTISVAGEVFSVPATLQNIPASNLGWTDGITLQIQLDINSISQGAYSIGMRAITVAVQ